MEPPYIGEFSRFSDAVIIKKKDDSMNMFMKHWISIFGVRNYIFSDNGRKFIGDDFYMCGKFNISFGYSIVQSMV